MTKDSKTRGEPAACFSGDVSKIESQFQGGKIMSGNHDLQPHHSHYSLTRRGLAIVVGATLAFALFAGTIYAAAAAEPPPQAPQREKLTIDIKREWKPWTGDLDGMIKRRVIRVLTVYSKTFYFVDKAVQRGAAYEIFHHFEQDLNKKLQRQGKLKHKHLKVRVVMVPVSRGDMWQALVDGKGDVAASNITITEERQKQVDFSSPVYPNVSELLISGPASPAVNSIDDLAGKEVFVHKASSYYESLVALNRRFTTENKPAVVIRDAPDALEEEDLIEMVNAGLIPLTVVDKHLADFWKQVFPKIKVHDGIVLRSGATIAWAFRKGSPQLKAALDDFLSRYGKGTAVGNTILKRYLSSAKYVKDAASQTERKKFLALIPYFQKYGDKYHVDWLLMAAQGYQESQLNQAVKSPVGAIGIMQVMPKTGEDLGVGDITQVDANIHAGIKYMRWMIDQYYGKEPMTELDKTLFAFASYNAGAGRISQLRRVAAKRGLDPNVWFHNVEYVAAEKIGPETVTYVANIYKYYVAYHLLMEASAKRATAIEKMKSQSKGKP
jgi:membrane-bound lytic murein transglycosylase MltF